MISDPHPRSEIEALWGRHDSQVEYDRDFSPAIESPPSRRSKVDADRLLNLLNKLEEEVAEV